MVFKNKTLGDRILEFILSVGGILGTLTLLGAEIEQSVVYAILGGGIVLVVLNHIVSFFQTLDKNVKSIKNVLERGENKDGEKENRG